MTYLCENCDYSIDIDLYPYIKWCKRCQINKLKKNFTNWTSGNEKIDDLIKETQLKISKYRDIIVEWIPYNQFNDIKEIAKVDFTTLYSAIWLDGPLKYDHNRHNRDSDDIYDKEHKRMSNEKVILKCLDNSQNNVNEFILNEAKPYIINKDLTDGIIYGISQDPNTKDYIMVLNDYCCEKCGNKYTYFYSKWCRPCQINNLKQNFVNWTSGNEIIDEFIQKMQLKTEYYDIMFEWIPYNQFNDITEIRSDSIILYSAIWLNGPLKYDYNTKWERMPNEKVALEFLHNSNNITNKILQKIKQIYGISRNPDTNDYVIVFQDFYCRNCGNQYTKIYTKWCEPCQINYLKQEFANWTSGDEIIDKFIQEMQLNIESDIDIIVEWIPYDQLINIKEISNSFTHYTAMWVNGPLQYEKKKQEYERLSNVKVDLKCLGNLQTITNEFLNKVRSYFVEDNFTYLKKIQGMSKNPHTKEYLMVFRNCYCNNYRWCESCKIDNLIQNFVNQTNGNEKIDKISELLSEAKFYSIDKIIGISQHPDTKDYIIVQDYFCKKCGNKYIHIYYKWCEPCQISNLKQKFANWTSGNKEIDNYVQEMQLKIESYDDIIVEWIPYNQFNNIKEIGKHDSSIQYMAIWMNGPLQYEKNKQEYERLFNKEVSLKCLVNSQDIISELLNEVKLYSIKNDDESKIKIYGVSQHPDIKDYILVLQDCCEKCGNLHINSINKWCKPCQINNLKQNFSNWTSGNEKIDDFIKETQLKISKYSDIIVEWVPYNQFNKIKKIIKSDSTVIYSAIWMNGPLEYIWYKREYKRLPNRKVDDKIYGISQDPNTKDFIIILQDFYCENCGNIYTDIHFKMCKSCYINNTNNFLYKTIEDEKINNFIQEMQSKIKLYHDIMVEWIPYNQFINIKEVGKGGFSTVYSAIWIDGPLLYDKNKQEYIRSPNMKVALKCLYNSQNITNKFLNEVKAYSISKGNSIHKIYGISQNSITKDYIIVLQYAVKGSFDNYKYFFKNCNWKKRIMPYVAPEVLKCKPYTQAADIYSFGMIMYFVATGKQPFANCAHDNTLAVNICNGIRPEISEKGVPKCYIDLMKKCLDSNPENRPIVNEIEELIKSFSASIYGYTGKISFNSEFKKQFEEAEEYRKENILSIENGQSTTHPQAYYTSRLLNPFTKDLINISSVEVIDFTDEQ
ncbi:hypothetical protein RclHR1_00370006 [Rhizophagus clarus]|uniref:Protein kinase domain-containing protein n=1 Tax=Rhizophagus clarus TaxID=94130 RepID=A0A2Z6RBX3_9GLOM|nr:hypothetical protein RclHR1_00370006 [Rhizophagus clarus]